MPYNAQGIRFSLTYPQCPVTPETAADLLDAKFPDLEWLIVSREAHADGTPHLHAAVRFHAQKHFRSPFWADLEVPPEVLPAIENQENAPPLELPETLVYHGNYQVTRNVRDWITYVIKDADFVARRIDPQSIIGRRGNSFSRIASMIGTGRTTRQINSEEPGFVMRYARQMSDYRRLLSVLDTAEKEINWHGCLADSVDEPQPTHDIVEWLGENICTPRSFKQKQLWIYGPTNMGKTSLSMQLDDELRVMTICMEEDFYDLYDDDSYDIIIFDEFTGQKRVSFMNQFVQGSNMTLRKKGTQIEKRKNLPVIVLSNYKPEDVYRNVPAAGISALLERFLVISVTEFIKIIFI